MIETKGYGLETRKSWAPFETNETRCALAQSKALAAGLAVMLLMLTLRRAR